MERGSVNPSSLATARAISAGRRSRRRFPSAHQFTGETNHRRHGRRLRLLPRAGDGHPRPARDDDRRDPLSDVDATLHRLLKDEALVAGGVLLALAVLAWWIVGVGLRPLNRMGDTAGHIAAGDLSRRVSPESTRTEVGRLGIALNQMLGQIERRSRTSRRARSACDASSRMPHTSSERPSHRYVDMRSCSGWEQRATRPMSPRR